MKRQLYLLVALVGFEGCTSCDPEPEGPWAPTTVPYDPECKTGCVRVGAGTLAHLGAVEIYANPNVDDPLAQWGDCLDSFLRCMETGEAATVAACLEASICPQPCKDEYAKRAAGTAGLDDQFLVMEAVFIHEDAPCRPEDEEEVSP